MPSCAAGDIRHQSFFAGVDWNALEARKVTPPFKPEVSDAGGDVGNFHPEFTDETPEVDEGVVDPRAEEMLLNAIDAFEGFSYTHHDMIKYH